MWNVPRYSTVRLRANSSVNDAKVTWVKLRENVW